MRDLTAALGLPMLIVTKNVLGAINHTRLTVEVGQFAGPVLGVVLNHPGPSPDASAASNAQALRRWGGAPLLGTLPYVTIWTARL